MSGVVHWYAMGGYAGSVWSAYALVFVGFCLFAVRAVRRLNHMRRQVPKSSSEHSHSVCSVKTERA